MASKRKFLSLQEKINAINRLDKGIPAYKVAEELGVGKTQIQTLKKRKRDVLEQVENNIPLETKRRRRPTGNEEINDLTYEWFKDAVSRRIPVTGPLLQTKALDFASRLNVNDFKASKGWLQSFQRRHSVVFGTMSGERGDVSKQTVNDWEKKIPTLCEGYEDKDIFNLDESGLFFRDTTRKTLHFKSDECAGGKRSKERVTFALCASMEGEKLKALVIGKSRSPRCFGKIDSKTLPVHYYNNKKAWMTSGIYEDYLNKINRQMRAQQRNILLFVDNAPSHPTLQFTNMKVVFLPPNTTSLTQPMDQGIIQTTKLKFRKRQLLHLTKEMDRQPTINGTDLLKQTTLLDAIFWLKNSWTEVEADTIRKCFLRCGFGQVDHEILLGEPCDSNTGECDSDVDDDADDDIPRAAVKLAQELFGCAFKELTKIDEELHTCETNDIDWDSASVLSRLGSDSYCSLSENVTNDEDDNESNETSSCITANEANEMVQKLKVFAINSGNLPLIDSLQTVDEQLTVIMVQKTRQTKIHEFFQCSRPV